MISRSATKHHLGVEPGFQWRGDEITRVEGLSDAVFGFAVTLLVISLEIPKTYNDFYRSLSGLPSFAITFLLLMFIWFEQYKFFRRYGLQDIKTVALTLGMLFVVLCYVYPLKFLFNGIFAPYIHALFPSIVGLPLDVLVSGPDVTFLMIFYNIGVIAVYGIFYFLYQNAFSKKDVLQLNPIECHDTIWSIRDSLFFVFLGTLGLVMAITRNDFLTGLSGMMYGPACAIYFSIVGRINSKKRTKLLDALEAKQ